MMHRHYEVERWVKSLLEERANFAAMRKILLLMMTGVSLCITMAKACLLYTSRCV